jgi:methionyl-tRNA synthetase
LSSDCVDKDLYKEFVETGSNIAKHYEARNFNQAMRLIMKLADKANQYIDEKKPWQLAKVEGSEREVHEITSLAINLFKVLMTYLKPVLPEMAKRSEEFLNIESLDWPDIETPLTCHKINNFKPLMTRIEDEQIDQMVESSRV